jgi:hypothetical protein
VAWRTQVGASSSDTVAPLWTFCKAMQDGGTAELQGNKNIRHAPRRAKLKCEAETAIETGHTGFSPASLLPGAAPLALLQAPRK